MTDDLSRLFEAERAVRAPAGGMERGLPRLLTDVGKRVAPLPVATGSLKLGLSLVSKWLMVGFVAGVGGAGAASQIWTAKAAAAPSAVSRLVTTIAVVPSVATRPVSEPAPSPALTTEPENPAVGVHTPRTPSASAAAPSTDTTTFDAELRLIAAAKSELEQGRPQLATAWLNEHAQRFPQGVFGVDREALRVLASCQQRRDMKEAQSFVARHPTSPMVERLLRACSPAASGSSNADFSKLDK